MAKPLEEFIHKAIDDLKMGFDEWTKEQMQDMAGRMFDPAMFSKVTGAFGGAAGGAPAFNPYIVLSLEKSCSDAEAKERYLDLMKIIHPDATGGKTSFLAVMVNIAYEQIRKERNL